MKNFYRVYIDYEIQKETKKEVFYVYTEDGEKGIKMVLDNLHKKHCTNSIYVHRVYSTNLPFISKDEANV